MKLERFKEKNNKRRFIVIFTVCCILLLAGVLLYNSFAVFTEEKEFNVINGTYQDPGDIYFAYYVDGVITRDLPKQNTGYIFDEESSNCTNGVVPTFDNSTWEFTADYSGYNATDYTRTKCNLYFKKIKTVNTVLESFFLYQQQDKLLQSKQYCFLLQCYPNNFKWCKQDITSKFCQEEEYVTFDVESFALKKIPKEFLIHKNGS